MPTYYDIIDIDDVPITEKTTLYLVKIESNYRIGGIASDINQLGCDPITRQTNYWPINAIEFLNNVKNENLSSEIFPEDKLTTGSVSYEIVKKCVGFDPETVESKSFNQTVINSITQEWQQDALNELLQSQGFFFNPPVQNTTISSQTLFQNWHAPATHALSGFRSEHVTTHHYLITEQNLSPEQALQEINELNWIQANTLKTLYTYGLRGEHLRDIKNYIENTYPEFDFFGEIYDVLEDRVLNQHLGLNEALEEIKQMNLEQFRQFTVD